MDKKGKCENLGENSSENVKSIRLWSMIGEFWNRIGTEGG